MFFLGETSCSQRAVTTALWCNFLVFSLKFGVWWTSSSHVIMAEVVHSVADFANQVCCCFVFSFCVQFNVLIHFDVGRHFLLMGSVAQGVHQMLFIRESSLIFYIYIYIYILYGSGTEELSFV